jgi:hypothetical protein
MTKQEMVKRLKEGCIAEEYFPGVLGNPVTLRRFGDDFALASSLFAPRQRSQFLLQFLKALSFTLSLGSWLRTALAGSPDGMAESGLRCVISSMSHYYGRVVHLRQLPTPCCHDAVALHASERFA